MDGSIRVGTKIDTSGAEKDLNRLQKECEKTADAIRDAGEKLKTTFTGMSAKQLEKSLEKVNKELQKTLELQAQVEAEGQAVSDSYKPMYDKATSEEQRGRIDEMAEAELEPINAKWAELNAKAEEYRKQISAIEAELRAQIQAEFEKNSAVEQGAEAREKEAAATKKSTRETAKLQSTATKASRQITREINRGIKRILRLSIAVLGVESAFTILRRATNAALADNEKLSNQLNSIWNVLGTAITPVIETLVKWITVAISYINAFVYALTGIDYVAKSNANALKKQTDATNAAVKASKQLAGFDEMNKLSDTSAGTSSGTKPGQFETVPVDTGKVEKMVDLFKKIKDYAVEIGAAILGWKLGKFIKDLALAGKKATGLGNKLKLLGKGVLITLGVTLVVTGIALETKGIVDAVKKELNKNNAGDILAGAGLTTGGAALIGQAFGSALVGGAIGAIIAGIPAMGVGIYDAIVNQMNWLNATLIPLGATMAGAGIGAIIGACGGPIGAGIGALIGLVIGGIVDLTLLIIEKWDELSAWIDENIVQPMAEFFAPLIDACKEAWAWIDENLIKPIKGFFEEIWEAITEIWNHAVEKAKEIKDGVIKAIKPIIEKVREIFAKIKEIFQALWWAFKEYIWNPMVNKLKGFYNDHIKPIIDKIKGVFSKVGAWCKEKIIDPIVEKITWLKNKAIDIFKKIGTTVVDFISGSVKAVINGLLWSIEKAINGFLKMLNGAIDLINKIPGVDIKPVELLTIPKLAQGGIVNNPGRGVPVIAGEAGAEAVLPLENNTGWMDILADKINGEGRNIVVQVMLSGKKIHEEIIRLSQRHNFATNGVI